VKRAVVRNALLVALCGSTRAHAAAGTAFNEPSRSAALGGAVTARPGDAGTIIQNPAGLADVSEPTLVLSGHFSRFSRWFQRTGEPKEETERSIGGFGLGVATPLPGPEWLRLFHFGFALDMPAEHVLRVSVAERTDQPLSPIYDARADRVSALVALAMQPFERVRFGAGVAITPSLDTPTAVTYDAQRSEEAKDQVIVRLDRDLEMDVSPFFGLRVDPFDSLALGLAYRDAAISRASGSQRTEAGGILADDPIDYFQFWDPAELAFGVMLGPFANTTFSVDATWQRWSEFRSGFNTRVEPAFENTLRVAAGVELEATRGVFARAGYAFEPTPIPEQTGRSNYLGADTHVVSLGGGLDFRKRWGAPLAVDLHLRGRFDGTQSARKNLDELGDSDPDLPGQQVDNLGYPGFQSSARFYQVGLTLTLFVGKDKKP
jgi:long-chain fatty acid transport protein